MVLIAFLIFFGFLGGSFCGRLIGRGIVFFITGYAFCAGLFLFCTNFISDVNFSVILAILLAHLMLLLLIIFILNFLFNNNKPFLEKFNGFKFFIFSSFIKWSWVYKLIFSLFIGFILFNKSSNIFIEACQHLFLLISFFVIFIIIIKSFYNSVIFILSKIFLWFNKYNFSNCDAASSLQADASDAFDSTVGVSAVEAVGLGAAEAGTGSRLETEKLFLKKVLNTKGSGESCNGTACESDITFVLDIAEIEKAAQLQPLNLGKKSDCTQLPILPEDPLVVYMLRNNSSNNSSDNSSDSLDDSSDSSDNSSDSLDDSSDNSSALEDDSSVEELGGLVGNQIPNPFLRRLYNATMGNLEGVELTPAGVQHFVDGLINLRVRFLTDNPGVVFEPYENYFQQYLQALQNNGVLDLIRLNGLDVMAYFTRVILAFQRISSVAAGHFERFFHEEFNDQFFRSFRAYTYRHVTAIVNRVAPDNTFFIDFETVIRRMLLHITDNDAHVLLEILPLMGITPFIFFIASSMIILSLIGALNFLHFLPILVNQAPLVFNELNRRLAYGTFLPISYVRVSGFVERMRFGGFFNFSYVFRAFEIYMESRGQALPLAPPQVNVNVTVDNHSSQNQSVVTQESRVQPRVNNYTLNFKFFLDLLRPFFKRR